MFNTFNSLGNPFIGRYITPPPIYFQQLSHNPFKLAMEYLLV